MPGMNRPEGHPRSGLLLRLATFALVGATGKRNVQRRRDGDVWGATSGGRVHLYGARVRPVLRKPLSDMTLSKLIKELGIAAVPHGFRSSFRDWAAERTNTPREVVETALAHTVRNPTEAAYARSDLFERRRRLMDDWEGYLRRTHGHGLGGPRGAHDGPGRVPIRVLQPGLVTRIGKLELRVPRDREGRFSTELFDRFQRSEKALVSALAEMYVQGVSTRKVKAVTEELEPGGEHVLPLQIHHRRWPSRPESSWTGE